MKSLKYIAVLSVALASLASCSDDSDWTPGPQEPDGKQGVFFNTDNPKTSLFIVDEPTKNITVTVSRTRTEGDITVPLTLEEGPEGMTIPQSVSFADGQSTASFLVNCDNIPTKTSFNIRIAVAEEFRHTYMSGSYAYEGSVVVSDWVLVDDKPTHTFYFTDNNGTWANLAAPVESPFYQLQGTDRFRIENFLNSGVDFEFEVGEPCGNTQPYYTWAHKLIPLSNTISITDYGWESYGTNEFGIYDSSIGDLAQWGLKNETTGEDANIAPAFFDYFDGDKYYSFVRWHEENGYGTDANGNEATCNVGWMSGFHDGLYNYFVVYWYWGNTAV